MNRVPAPIIAVLFALALGACGRSGPNPAESKDAVMAMWMGKHWDAAFAACDKAFRRSDGTKNVEGSLMFAECAIEASTQAGKPELSLPLQERLLASYTSGLSRLAAVRLANNHGVALLQSGKREKGLARLRGVLDDLADPNRPGEGWSADTARAIVVRNLAYAYYETASEPAVRAWVEEQAAWYLDYFERHPGNAGSGIGSAAALDAISLVGKRQANTGTPAWDAAVREREALEERVTSHDPQTATVCERRPLGDIRMDLCMHELTPPA
ncbi:MAG: hypothetical protein IPP91_15535 [Betaproteobacteria bacterium]|nr:hypothetical protein [Betaproteobacteria bacterium]